jgi:peroxiredoxin
VSQNTHILSISETDDSFSPSCSDQVPGYIQKYEEFQGKGVKDIYVVSINDMFVMQAWRKDLLAKNEKEGKETSTVKFGMYTLKTLGRGLTN